MSARPHHCSAMWKQRQQPEDMPPHEMASPPPANSARRRQRDAINAPKLQFFVPCFWRSLPNSRSRGRRSPLESAPINITPREKNGDENAVWAVRRAEAAPLRGRCRSPGHLFARRAAGNRSPDGVGRPQIEYARLKAEFDTMQAEMGCAATRTSLLHTSLLHCSRDSRPVRLRSVPGQRRRSPVCDESRARPSARSWPPSGKCCPGLRSRTTSTSLARRAE